MFSDRNSSNPVAAGVATVVLVLAALLASGCATKRPAQHSIDPDLAQQTFETAWTIIYETHFDTEFNGVDWLALKDELGPRAAEAKTVEELRRVLRDMIARLGQSHFALIPENAADFLADESEGGDGQVGVQLRLIAGQFMVSAVEPGLAADAAGVRPGWILNAIGDDSIDAWIKRYEGIDDGKGGQLLAVESVLSRLAGAPGTTVSLEWLNGDDDTVSVELERQPHVGQRVQVGHMPPFFARLSQDEITPDGGDLEIGVIRMNVWMTTLALPFGDAVDAFRQHDGIVIDLRGNPGGIGAMVMGAAGHFLDERISLGKMIMREQELNFVANPRRVNSAGQRVEPYSGPVAILIDELSASTSEVFVGGMQDIGRARLFGQRTAGMALPAVAERLPNGDTLYHAIANFVTPSGVQIEGNGIAPDEEAAPTRDGLLAGRDEILEIAVEWISRAAQTTESSNR